MSKIPGDSDDDDDDDADGHNVVRHDAHHVLWSSPQLSVSCDQHISFAQYLADSPDDKAFHPPDRLGYIRAGRY